MGWNGSWQLPGAAQEGAGAAEEPGGVRALAGRSPTYVRRCVSNSEAGADEKAGRAEGHQPQGLRIPSSRAVVYF